MSPAIISECSFLPISIKLLAINDPWSAVMHTWDFSIKNPYCIHFFPDETAK